MQQLGSSVADILTDKVHQTLEAAISISPNLAAAVIVLLLGALSSSILKMLAERVLNFRRSREALRTAVRTIIAALVWTFTLLVAATITLPGLSPAEAFAGVGIGSLAVGLAFRDIFENFLAGLLILLREPMRLGDYIECGDVSGSVHRITIRDTYLRDTDGTLRLVPNAHLFKNPVRVLTDQTVRRQIAIVGVHYDTDLDGVPEIIRDAIGASDDVFVDRPIQVFAQSFSSSSVDFEVAWWSGAAPVDARRSRDDVLRRIKRAFDAHGITIPFPHRKLVFDGEPTHGHPLAAGASRQLDVADTAQ